MANYILNIHSYYRHYKFNKFIVSKYGEHYRISQFITWCRFVNNSNFEYIDKHFKVIISLPLDEIMYSLNNRIV